MPEGHTLHKAARKQRPVLAGTVVRASSPQGRFTDAALVDRARVLEIEAFGKHLLYRFQRRGCVRYLHVHLGLAGRFDLRRTPAPVPRASTRLRLVGPTHTLDLRGPLICEVVDEARATAIIERLGPDPIRPRTTATRFRARLAATRIPIGAMLLDQSAIAGVGNVYRAELLYLTRIDPRRPARDLSRTEVDVLWRLARVLLRAGVSDGRIITTRYGGPDLAPLHPRQRTFAYKQHTCARCRGMIHQVVLAGRPCYFCPRCQAR